jgi:hypothetical protein
VYVEVEDTDAINNLADSFIRDIDKLQNEIKALKQDLINSELNLQRETERAERLLKAGDELHGQMEDNKHAIHWRDTFPATECWTNKRNFEAAMAEWERVAADG